MESHFYSMDFFFLSQEFFKIHSEKFLLISFLCCFRISRIMNAKKISKFEREDKSNGIPLVQHGIFFSFTRIFLGTFRNIPYNFLLCCVRISRIMNVKKTRNSRGKTRSMESHFYTIVFLSQEFSYEHSEGRQGTAQHVSYGMRKRPPHGKSVPRKQRPTHVKSDRRASSDFSGASSK